MSMLAKTTTSHNSTGSVGSYALCASGFLRAAIAPMNRNFQPSCSAASWPCADLVASRMGPVIGVEGVGGKPVTVARVVGQRAAACGELFDPCLHQLHPLDRSLGRVPVKEEPKQSGRTCGGR
jgi:hypothetical protein